MDISVNYFDLDYRNLVQFKRACIDGALLPDTVLSHCSCGYYKKYNAPCSHMYYLALKNDIFSKELNSADSSVIIAKLNSLSNMCFKKLSAVLYGGYYFKPHDIKDLERYYNKILQAGIITACDDGCHYVFSDLVLDNIFFVLHCVFTDPRFSK